MPKAKKTRDFQKPKLKVGSQRVKDGKELQTMPKIQTVSISVQPSVRKHLSKNETDTSPSPDDRIKAHLSRLRHYSPSIRSDAVSGLHDILKSHAHVTSSPEIRQNLNPILSQIAAMMEEREASVRANVHKLLAFLFPLLPERDLLPFYPMLLAHVNSSLAHLDAGVGRSALAVLGLLSRHYPLLISSSAHKFFPSLVGFTKEATKGKRKTTVRGILNELLNVLRVMLRRHVTSAEEQCDCSFLTGIRTAESSQEAEDGWIESDAFRLQFSSLVSILFELWIECDPSRGFSDDTCLSIMCQIVEVLLCFTSSFRDWTVFRWFFEKYRKKLLKHFLPYFPFGSTCESARQNVKETLQMLNFHFCQFLLSMDVKIENEPWVKEAFDYVIDSAKEERDFSSAKSSSYLQAILAVIDSRVKAFSEGSIDGGLLTCVSQLVCILTQKKLPPSVIRNVLLTLNRLVVSCPDLGNDLLEAGQRLVVDILSTCASYCRELAALPLLIQVLLQSASPFMAEQLTGSVLVNVASHSDCQPCILQPVLFYLPELPKSFYKKVVELVERCEFKVDLLCRILRLLTLRESKSDNLKLQALQSALLTGPACGQQSEVQGFPKMELLCQNIEEWKYKCMVVDVVCEINEEVLSGSQQRQLVQFLLQKIQASKTAVSELAAYGVLQSVLKWSCPGSSEVSHLLIPVVTSCLAFCGDRSGRSDLAATIAGRLLSASTEVCQKDPDLFEEALKLIPSILITHPD